MKTLNRFLALATLSVTALPGCVQQTAIPTIARAGDSISLGIGGIKRNWHGAPPKNMQITITDSASNSYNLVPTNVFQAYPDYRAIVNTLAIDGSTNVQLEPYDGSWFVVASLRDNTGSPLSLATGMATVSVTGDNQETKLDEVGGPLPQDGNIAQIPLEIIAGPPSGVDFATQLGAFDNRGSHLLVRPATTPATAVGGAYYVLNYASDAGFGTPRPIVFPVAHNPFININYSIHENGDGTGSYHIFVYNTAGFVSTYPRDPRAASLADLGVNIEYFDPALTDMETNFTVDLADSYYIDTSGNKITGLVPELLHSSDL